MDAAGAPKPRRVFARGLLLIIDTLDSIELSEKDL